MKTVCMLIFATLMVMAFPMVASADLAAGTPQFTWTPPTKSIDGTNIPASGANSLATYKLYCDGVAAPKASIGAPASSYQSGAGDFAVGAHSCSISAINVAGNESAKSAVAPFVVPPPVSTPLAPTNLGVQ